MFKLRFILKRFSINKYIRNENNSNILFFRNISYKRNINVYYKSVNNLNKILLGTSITALIIYKIFERRKNLVLNEYNQNKKEIALEIGSFKSELPLYTMKEVAEHSSLETGVWVTYKEGVYDITKFISEHPGGDQILLAAGSSVEPFWMLYAVHNNPHVLNILETLRIGNLSKEDSKKFLEGMNDPYISDPMRHPVLKPASLKPFNAEAPLLLLVENFITPNDLFYVRNHLPVPEIDPETYELEVEIEGTSSHTISLSLEDLKRMPKHTIISTIMCAGNRRSEMVNIKPVKGLNWGAAAVGNAKFTGVLLRDILKLVGIDENSIDYKHVQFEALDYDPIGKSYGASIPLWKAVDKRGDVILAYEMNDVPIPRDHGYPIRVIVPGVVGARNVKWLGKIIISKNESNSHWQQNDYKGFSPSTDWDTVDFTKSPAIQELPVISAICTPSNGESVKIKDGYIVVKGYAWSGGGQKIVRVDVTGDQGKTWHVANLDFQGSADPPQHWSWTLWSVKIPVNKGDNKMEIWAKAVDSCYNTQPESFENIWNLRGVLSNAYHRIYIKLQ